MPAHANIYLDASAVVRGCILLCFSIDHIDYVQGFARSLHTSAKAPHACSRLPAVFVGAAYSALGLLQTDRTLKRCRKHQQTLLRCKSCQAILSMRVTLLHLCAKTAQNPVHGIGNRNDSARVTIKIIKIIPVRTVRSLRIKSVAFWGPCTRLETLMTA